MSNLQSDLKAYEDGVKKGLIQATSTHYDSNNPKQQRTNRRQVRKSGGIGKESIFWDPVFNPHGVAPPGFRNELRSKYSKNDESDSGETIDIPLPEYENFKAEKDAETMPAVESKQVYSSAPVIRDLVKEATSAFVPVAVQKKKIENSSGSSKPRSGVIAGSMIAGASGPMPAPGPMMEEYGSEDEDEDEDNGEYDLESGRAPEEEEYWRKRIRDETEDFDI